MGRLYAQRKLWATAAGEACGLLLGSAVVAYRGNGCEHPRWVATFYSACDIRRDRLSVAVVPAEPTAGLMKTIKVLLSTLGRELE